MTFPAHDQRHPSSYCVLLAVVRDEFGRVAYTHKTHQKMIDQLVRCLLWEKRINAILIAVTAGNTIGVLIGDSRRAEVMAVVLSAVALLTTVYGLSRNRERLIEQHRGTANALWLLRERYRHFIGDLRSRSVSEPDARKLRDVLAQQAAQIYAGAPDTDEKAYRAAQKALKEDEELTFSDREIDVMLPGPLRSTSAEFPLNDLGSSPSELLQDHRDVVLDVPDDNRRLDGHT